MLDNFMLSMQQQQIRMELVLHVYRHHSLPRPRPRHDHVRFSGKTKAILWGHGSMGRPRLEPDRHTNL